MKNKLIAQRYAKAIFALIEKDGYQSFLEDIDALTKLEQEHPESLELCASPLLNVSQRKEMIEVLASQLLNKDIWHSAFKILLEKQRFSLVLNIADEIHTLIMITQNKQRVNLTLAREIDEESLANIQQHIESVLKTDVEIEVKLDPSIIGGFVAETTTMRLDGSIYYNLNRFKTMLYNI